MILSVYSATPSEAKSKQEDIKPLVLPLEDEARMDQRIYVQHGKLVQNEEELSKLMASVHNTLMRYLIRQSYALVTHDQQPGGAAGSVDDIMTKAQARLFSASENKLHTAITATALQRKLAHGTYSLYLRTLVATWQCIMSLANAANRDMVEVDRDEFMREVLHMQVETDVAGKTVNLLQQYHARVSECALRVDQLRKAAMQQLWQGHTNVAIPLDLHINMFKNYLSQVRAWLQQQPQLALS